MVTVAGVDGCRGGWVAVTDAGAAVLPSFAAVLDALPADAVVAVDVPIGLEDAYVRGGRACDRAARALLGPKRGASVFPAPPRRALRARSIEQARSKGWPATKQGLGILPKIVDVDRVMAPSLQSRVFEVHPELSFCRMNRGVPVLSNKLQRAGRDERRALLAEAGVPVPARCGQGEAEDDLLDACALWWSARRIAVGRSGRVPEQPPVDSRGLRMEINW